MVSIEQVRGISPVTYKIVMFGGREVESPNDLQVFFLSESGIRALRAGLEAFAQAPLISKVTVDY